ncbi:peptide ABC transporter ATP-binding protein [Paenibacillus montaniterrae]|uniref:Peptide ABC transporter ATP-binding protein n=1 Tax=Paenibacillus montaniterrae TaxID=429341 RepID=A0A919YPP2_9BACL|nr:ABC transporter ATP-binding protein [Paenibacillus montaniterrae]GIP15979.1 peptide ABC transporter ATP-binding protein [Paenibacillus montaniterrae]
MSHLLEVNHLQTHFKTPDGILRAVNGVSFTVDAGETLAIVGESGSGKSVTSMSILGLVSDPGKVVGGEILFEGKNLLRLTKKEYRNMRGKAISVIFQEPMTSLNPIFTVGFQISEVLRTHYKLNRKAAKQRAIEMLDTVGIANAEKVYARYPHQLSGGMRQRVMIAIALVCQPKLLIADEPTTALDVTIQAQILELIQKLAKEQNTGVILITHDLGVVAEMADKVAVMYGGEIVEHASVEQIFHRPSHPYTQGLLASLPKIHEDEQRLYSLPGTVPNLLESSEGCTFAPRCKFASEACLQSKPRLALQGEQHWVSCLKAEEVRG